MDKYTSYGDMDRVEQDAATIAEIIGRQGDGLVIDVVAERIGHVVNKFKLNSTERDRLFKVTLGRLSEAILERT
jgi:hypothetical protein